MGVHKGFFALFLLGIVWLSGKFLLPLVFPFLLGLGLAMAAEPVVNLGVRRLKLGRGLAAGLGVSITLLLITGVVLFLGALAVRELGQLAAGLPETAQKSSQVLEHFLIDLSTRAPEPVGPVLTGAVQRFFRSSASLADQAVQKVPGVVSGLLGKLPDIAMGLGTGILSGYFLSVRLPKLRQWGKEKLPAVWYEKALPTLAHLRQALGKWLLAQGKLMAITYGIVALGLLLLKIPYAFAWAVLVAAVDAVPLLGTGTVLVPWALVRFLQADPFTGAGLLCIYALAAVTRTVLEPRLFGKHLGLDPLVMLIFLYFGYRLWGFMGIVISPLLATLTKVLTENPSPWGKGGNP